MITLLFTILKLNEDIEDINHIVKNMEEVDKSVDQDLENQNEDTEDIDHIDKIMEEGDDNLVDQDSEVYNLQNSLESPQTQILNKFSTI